MVHFDCQLEERVKGMIAGHVRLWLRALSVLGNQMIYAAHDRHRDTEFDRQQNQGDANSGT